MLKSVGTFTPGFSPNVREIMERFAALITAAVTGKIDVRHVDRNRSTPVTAGTHA